MTAINLTGELVNEADVVGRHDNGCTSFAGVLEDTNDVRSRLWVKITRWLIGNNNLRSVQQGTCNGNTLLFTTR